MTISTTTSKVTYQGNGATTSFTFPFVGDDYTDLSVVYTDTSGSSVTLDPSQYTVTINPASAGQLWGVGGSVTYPNSGSPPVPIASGTYLTIIRSVPYTQGVTINNQGAFYPQVVEQALDILELQIQQLKTATDYAISTPLEDITPPSALPPAAERANGYLGFDNLGQPIIITTSPPTPVPVATATPRRVTTTGTATISMTSDDSLGGVSIYQTGPATTSVQLPSGYGPYPVFDGGVNAATYPITVLPPSGFTILGMSSYTLVYNGQSAIFYNDGSQIVIG